MVIKKKFFLIAVLFFCTTPDCLGFDFLGRFSPTVDLPSFSALLPRFNVPRLCIPRFSQLPSCDGTLLQRFAILSGLTSSVVGGVFISPIIAMTAACGFGAYACWGNVDIRTAIAAHRCETAAGFKENGKRFDDAATTAALNHAETQGQLNAINSKVGEARKDIEKVEANVQRNHAAAMEKAKAVHAAVDTLSQQSRQSFNKIDVQVSQLSTNVEAVKKNVEKGAQATAELSLVVSNTNKVVTCLNQKFDEQKATTADCFEKQQEQIQGVAKKVDGVDQKVDGVDQKVAKLDETVTQYDKENKKHLNNLQEQAGKLLDMQQEARDKALAAKLQFEQLFESQKSTLADQGEKIAKVEQGIDYLVTAEKSRQLNSYPSFPPILAGVFAYALKNNNLKSFENVSRSSADPQMNFGNEKRS